MPIEIRMNGQDAGEEIASLYRWLSDDDDLRRHARLSLMGSESEPGKMGATFEVIQLVVDSGFQALNFAIAYATWRGTRRSRPDADGCS